jgi:hypothetical protein
MRRLLPVLLLLAPLACNRSASVPVAVSGPQSPPGWEVRYNAAAALARRGSDKVLDARVRETLLEMLDEEQQLRNFRVTEKDGTPVTSKDGQPVPDSAGAQLTVISTLQALGELHRLRPELDLAPFRPAIDKLAGSPNLAVRTRARETQQLLTKN